MMSDLDERARIKKKNTARDFAITKQSFDRYGGRSIGQVERGWYSKSIMDKKSIRVEHLIEKTHDRENADDSVVGWMACDGSRSKSNQKRENARSVIVGTGSKMRVDSRTTRIMELAGVPVRRKNGNFIRDMNTNWRQKRILPRYWWSPPHFSKARLIRPDVINVCDSPINYSG